MNVIGLLLPVLVVFIYQPGPGSGSINLSLVLSLYVVANLVLLGINRWLVGRALRRFSPTLSDADQPLALRYASRVATGVFVMANALFFVAVFILDLPLFFVIVLGIPARLVVGDLLCVAIPYAVLMISRALCYPMWMRVREAAITPRTYMELGFRRLLVFVAPQLLYFSAFRLVLYNIPAARQLADTQPSVFLGVIMSCILLFFLLSPALVRHLFPRHRLGERPGDDPALISAVESVTRRAGVDLGTLFVWDSVGLPFANAVVTGMFSHYRHAYFSDYLLEALSLDEIVAVFAHEMGHVHFRHLMYNYVLSVAMVLVLVWCIWAAEPLFEAASPVVVPVMVLAIIAAYTIFVMRVFLNRFEHQADLYAAGLLGDVGLLQRTLRRIADLNLSLPSRRSLTHPSIDDRCAALARAARSDIPELLRREKRRNNRWLIVFVLLLLATVSLLELARV